MKLRTTTPVLKTYFGKIATVLMVLTLTFVLPMQFPQTPAFADQYDDKINKIQNEIDAYQGTIDELGAKTNTLQSELSKIENEKSLIESKIQLTQTRYEQLLQDIKDTEEQIKNNKDALGATIADLYVENEVTPIEMVFSSNTISDYLDKQEYRNSVRDELVATIEEIKKLKKEIEADRDEVANNLEQQKAQKDLLAQKQTEQQNLIAQTQGQQAAYESLVIKRNDQVSSLKEQQKAALAALTNNGSNTAGSAGAFQYRNYTGSLGACGGGYPTSSTGIYGQLWGCGYQADDLGSIDEWALYNRECVSYTAWASYYRFGKHVTSFLGQGNANNWPTSAPAIMGANVNNTPKVGATAIANIGPVGHSMIVEKILDDGWVEVSQYNFGFAGNYSRMEIKASGVVFVHFQDR